MKMQYLFAAALAGGVMFAATSAKATDVLVYSFESPTLFPDGFQPNPFGGGPTVVQDTIGATEGTHSLKFALGAPGHTFEGALTICGPTDTPKLLDPNATAIKVDVTVAPNDGFTGSFANMGVTYIGTGFVPIQTEGSAERSVVLTPGTTTTLTIPLLTFGDVPILNSFQPIGPNPLADFQFYINKDGNAPITVYLDNVRVVVPEPATACSASALLGGLALARRRRRA